MVDNDKYAGIIMNNLELMGFKHRNNSTSFTLEARVDKNKVEISFEFLTHSYPTCKIGNDYIDMIQDNVDVELDPLFWGNVEILVGILAEKHENIITVKDSQVNAVNVSVETLEKMGFNKWTHSTTESHASNIFKFSLVYSRPYNFGHQVWIHLNFRNTDHGAEAFLREGRKYIWVDVEIKNKNKTISMPIKLDCQPYFWNCVSHICDMLAKPEVDYVKCRKTIIENLQPLGFKIVNHEAMFNNDASHYYRSPSSQETLVGIEFEYNNRPYATVKLENHWIDIIQKNIDVEDNAVFWKYIEQFTITLAIKPDARQVQEVEKSEAFTYPISHLENMGFVRQTPPSASDSRPSMFFYRKYQRGKIVWITLHFSKSTRDNEDSFPLQGEHYIWDDVELSNDETVISMPINLECPIYFWESVWHIVNTLCWA